MIIKVGTILKSYTATSSKIINFYKESLVTKFTKKLTTPRHIREFEMQKLRTKIKDSQYDRSNVPKKRSESLNAARRVEDFVSHSLAR